MVSSQLKKPSDWSLVKLGKITNVTTGGTPSRGVDAYWNGKIPWLNTGKIDFNIISEADEFITDKGLKNSSAKLFPAGTLVMAMFGQGATRGRVGILGIDSAFNQACSAIEPLNENVFTEYLFFYLMWQYEYIRTLGHGGNQSNLNASLIKDIDILLPTKTEQQEIVEILSCWNKAIEKIEKLILAKQKLKKTIMLQLLTGELRFKEFQKQQWAKYTIGKLLKEVERPVRWDDNELYELISIRRRSGGLFLREKLYGHQIKTKNLKVAMKDDFLISKMQAVRGALGLTTREFDGMKVSESYVALVPCDSNILDIRFFNYLTQLPFMYNHVFLSCHGVHIEKMTFSLNEYFKKNIVIPTSIKEQQRIVDVISAAENEICSMNFKLEMLKQQKKGLMQKLLTGKIRVKV